MILDTIAHHEQYRSLSAGLAKAFHFLSSTDLLQIENGKYEIDGSNIFALVSTYNTKQSANAKFEAHKKYIDVQYIVRGAELIGYAPLKGQEIVSPYNEEKDIVFYTGEKSMLRLDEGMFAVFFPQDVHQPGVMINASTAVKKVVVKVSVAG